MTLIHGLFLGLFGTLLTIVCMIIAYIIGYKTSLKQKPRELTEVQKSLKNLGVK